jgi:hypothetical protein
MPTLADVLRNYTPPTSSVLADPIKQHFRTLPQQLVANQQALDKTMSGVMKTDLLGRPNPNYYPEAMTEFSQMMPNFMGATAWHGTPHTIKGKFDISKVGTGEGAQAYGHGMYFAESPNVAETYRHAGEVVKYVPTMQKFTNGPNYFMDETGNYMKVRDYVKNDIPVKVPKEEYLQKFNEVKAIQETQKPGNLYKVDIPDEYIPNMLDWDKPLSKQSKAVQDALAKYDSDLYSPKGADYDSAELGQSIYQRIIQNNVQKFGHGGNQKRASEDLNALGIKGIKYYDEGSREAKKGTSNFVVFDPSEVKILEQNGKPLTRKEILIQEAEKALK